MLLFPLATFFAEIDLGLTGGDLGVLFLSRGVDEMEGRRDDMEGRRDEVEGEGVVGIVFPVLKEDERENFDALRSSGVALSRAGVGVLVEGSCF